MILNPYVYGGAKVPEVGDFYGGGVVFYIFQSGDLGYVEGETHGIICAISDQNSGVVWGGAGTVTGAILTAIGTGAGNTATIISKLGAGTYSASICTAYNGGGYNDWFLPSKYELSLMYQKRTTINITALANGGGAFVTTSSGRYWSSTEASDYNAIYQSFFDGQLTTRDKGNAHKIRAVRYF